MPTPSRTPLAAFVSAVAGKRLDMQSPLRRLLGTLARTRTAPSAGIPAQGGWGRWLALAAILLAGNASTAISWRAGIPINTGISSTALAAGLYAWLGGSECWRVGRSLWGWRPKLRQVWFALGAGLALAFPSVLFFAVASLGGGVGYSPVAALSARGLLMRELVEIPLLTAFVEELVFRQYLYRAFRQRTLGATLLVNAGIFTLWHLVVTARTVSETNFAASPWLLAGSYLGSLGTVFAAGLVFAFVRWRTGSFLYSALTHWMVVGMINLAVWVW